MNKKVVVFGGGTGMSYLLRGLKQYPLDITAVVSVCDDGGSTGILRDELDMLAVGDIRKVLIAMSKKEGDFENLLNYRFSTPGTLNKHTVGNILLAAATNITGSVQQGIGILSQVLNLNGKVMPFTEDKVTLVGEMEDGSIIKGEHHITQSPKNIKRVYYEEEPNISTELLDTIKNADIILLSMGSLFTSVIPTLLSKKIKSAIDKSHAKIVYSCNLFTQPGETDGYTVSDHVKTLNQYLGKRKVEYVIANSEKIAGSLADKYATEEQKDPVVLDRDKIKKICKEAIIDDLVIIENNVFRHDYFKLGYLIFSLTFNHNYKNDINGGKNGKK
jgi:uncharacterized cofD-like protein